MRVPGCGTVEAVTDFGKRLSKLWTVKEFHYGTVLKPTAGWYVVRSDLLHIADIRKELKREGLNSRIDMIEKLRMPQDGEVFARQLSLF